MLYDLIMFFPCSRGICRAGGTNSARFFPIIFIIRKGIPFVHSFFFSRRSTQNNPHDCAAGLFGSGLFFLLAFFPLHAYNPTVSSVESELRGSFHETYP